jgi:hypothetical protein
MRHLYFVDESGDLGWSFALPYGRGGSSRTLVIAALSLPACDQHRPERLMRELSRASRWNSRREKKWIDASLKAKLHFTRQAVQLATAFPQIRYHAIAVTKADVPRHLREDCNKLYSYMVRLLLAGDMATRSFVDFLPDARSVKVGSDNSLHDYLSTWLGCDLGVPTSLRTFPTESRDNKCLQFTDMLAGVVHSHLEFARSECFNLIAGHLHYRHLDFGEPPRPRFVPTSSHAML